MPEKYICKLRVASCDCSAQQIKSIHHSGQFCSAFFSFQIHHIRFSHSPFRCLLCVGHYFPWIPVLPEILATFSQSLLLLCFFGCSFFPLLLLLARISSLFFIIAIEIEVIICSMCDFQNVRVRE